MRRPAPCGPSAFWGSGSDRATGDVERERGGVRYVEAFDRAGQVEAGEAVAGCAGQLAQALAFGAEHERQRRAQFERGEVVGRAAIEADCEKAALFERHKAARQVL